MKQMSDDLQSELAADEAIPAHGEQSTTAIQASSDGADELDGLRAQVKELVQRLDESEQSQRELAEVLASMGIRCRPMRA